MSSNAKKALSSECFNAQCVAILSSFVIVEVSLLLQVEDLSNDPFVVSVGSWSVDVT